MKKSLIVVFLMIGTWAHAQFDEKALAALKAMSAKYKSIPSFSANISSSLINESEGIREEVKGEITVKGEKYFLKLSEQEVINDGKTIWTYLVDLNEVNVENYSPSDDEMTPSKIYNADYTKGYKYILVGEQAIAGVICQEIDLIPNSRTAQFFKIKLFISKKDNTLQSWTMFDRTGNKYVYTISKFMQKAVPDSFFSFDKSKYPGVEIVDLR
jgi:outer membrane lipoprotein carrier protein